MGSTVSKQGDVYSFGILLLEIFTGKRPTNEMFRDGLNLHKFAKVNQLEQMMEIIDPTLVLLEEEEEEPEGQRTIRINSQLSRKERIQECLISLVRIGIACSMESPRERLNMSEVSKQLNLIKKFFLDGGVNDG